MTQQLRVNSGWVAHELTTDDDSIRVSFVGEGVIFVNGTFGGGSVLVKPISENGNIVAGAGLYTLSGSTMSCIVPTGKYQLELSGSTAATVELLINDSIRRVRES